jgi:hypothetical protein
MAALRTEAGAASKFLRDTSTLEKAAKDTDWLSSFSDTFNANKIDFSARQRGAVSLGDGTGIPTTSALDDSKYASNSVKSSKYNPSSLGKDGKLTDKSSASETETATNSRLSKLKEYLPSKSQILFGLGATAFVGYLGVMLDATDGESAFITQLQIIGQVSTGTIINIVYTPPNTNFSPCINDSIDISSDIPFIGGLSGIQIVAIVDETTIQIISPTTITTFNNNPSPSPSPSAINLLKISSGTFTDHSSLLNQFNSTVSGCASIVNNAIVQAANSAGIALGLASSLAAQAINDGVSLIALAASDSKWAICKTVPFLCNTTVWIIVAIVVVVIIIILLII